MDHFFYLRPLQSLQDNENKKNMKLFDQFDYLRSSYGQIGVIKINQGPVRDLLMYYEANLRPQALLWDSMKLNLSNISSPYYIIVQKSFYF